MKTGVCEMLKNTTGEEEKKIPSEQESNLTHFLFFFFLDFRKRQKQKLKKSMTPKWMKAAVISLFCSRSEAKSPCKTPERRRHVHHGSSHPLPSLKLIARHVSSFKPF